MGRHNLAWPDWARLGVPARRPGLAWPGLAWAGGMGMGARPHWADPRPPRPLGRPAIYRSTGRSIDRAIDRSII